MLGFIGFRRSAYLAVHHSYEYNMCSYGTVYMSRVCVVYIEADGHGLRRSMLVSMTRPSFRASFFLSSLLSFPVLSPAILLVPWHLPGWLFRNARIQLRATTVSRQPRTQQFDQSSQYLEAPISLIGNAMASVMGRRGLSHIPLQGYIDCISINNL